MITDTGSKEVLHTAIDIQVPSMVLNNKKAHELLKCLDSCSRPVCAGTFSRATALAPCLCWLQTHRMHRQLGVFSARLL